MNTPPVKKLFFCDLDGTLLTPDCKLSPENRAAIGELRARGILLIPCSGRCFAEIPSALVSHPAVELMVLSNGACVMHSKTGETVMRFSMPPEEHLFLYDLQQKAVSSELFHEAGRVYCDRHKFMHHTEYGINQYTYDALVHTTTLLDSFDEKRRAAEFLDMSVACFRDKEAFDAYTACVAADGRFSYTTSTSGGLEVMHGGISKGATLRHVAELYGIPLADTLAAGDSHNDTTMFAAVGYSMATANADEDVRAAADRIICKNSEHILPHILANVL